MRRRLTRLRISVFFTRFITRETCRKNENIEIAIFADDRVVYSNGQKRVLIQCWRQKINRSEKVSNRLELERMIIN